MEPRKVLSPKFLLATLLIIFLATFLLSCLAISLTPYGQVTERVYSYLQTSSSNDSSAIRGAWKNQMLSPQPGAGSTNISRDTAIWIDEPRPVRVENLSLNPAVPCKIRNNYYIFSAYTEVLPTELLQPNTTYNVSAIVAGTPSWWTFTTSSEPHESMFKTFISPSLPWVAFIIGGSVTFGFFIYVAQKKANLG